MGSTIEYFGDRAERLLPSGVPYLQFEDFVLHTDQIWAELDPHSHIVVLFELILDQSFEHTRFPDTYTESGDIYEFDYIPESPMMMSLNIESW